MGERSRRVIVQVLDTDNVLRDACQAGDLGLSDDEQNTVRFFLAHLIEKLWKKFDIQDIDIQFLIAQKTDIDITMSASHLEEFYQNDKHILEHFHSFRLKVQDMRSYITLEQNTRYKWKMLSYLEKEYTEEERQVWDRPVQDYYYEVISSREDLEEMEAWRDAGAPERTDYLGTYFLDLAIDDVILAKYKSIQE